MYIEAVPAATHPSDPNPYPKTNKTHLVVSTEKYMTLIYVNPYSFVALGLYFVRLSYE